MKQRTWTVVLVCSLGPWGCAAGTGPGAGGDDDDDDTPPGMDAPVNPGIDAPRPDTTTPPPPVDARPDAMTVDPPPPPPPTCTADSSYGTMGDVYGTGETGGDPGSTYDVFYGPLQLDFVADNLVVELLEGYGVFAAGIAPGTYTISGPEANYGTCGLCVRIVTDWDGLFPWTDDYLMISGTVTLTSVTGNITGTVNDAVFQHVDIDPVTYMSTPADSCQSTITAAAFDAPLSGP